MLIEIVYLRASLRHMGSLVWGLFYLTCVTIFVLYFVLLHENIFTLVKDVLRSFFSLFFLLPFLSSCRRVYPWFILRLRQANDFPLTHQPAAKHLVDDVSSPEGDQTLSAGHWLTAEHS